MCVYMYIYIYIHDNTIAGRRGLEGAQTMAKGFGALKKARAEAAT